MFISVLLPDPLVPITATYSFFSTFRSTPLSARIVSTPTVYTLVMLLREMTAMGRELSARLRRHGGRGHCGRPGGRAGCGPLDFYFLIVLHRFQHLEWAGDDEVGFGPAGFDHGVREVA